MGAGRSFVSLRGDGVRKLKRCRLPIALMIVAVLGLGACANMPGREPVQVTVADIQFLPGQGLEMRMMVSLRVQNPNDVPIDFNGAYVRLEVLDQTFATGVSDEQGTIPRFGESIISVPVTISMVRMALNALRMVNGQPVDRINYKLEGRLNGPIFGSIPFRTQGEFAFPNAMGQ